MRELFLRFPFLRSTFHHNKKNHIIWGGWRFKRIQATARHTVLLQSSQNSFAPLFFFRKEKGGRAANYPYDNYTQTTLFINFFLFVKHIDNVVFAQIRGISKSPVFSNVLTLFCGNMGISNDLWVTRRERQNKPFFCIFLWVFFSPWAAGPRGKKPPRWQAYHTNKKGQ